MPTVRRSFPEIIVTDVMLPGQSGLDLVTLLRHDPTLARIPILVLTARAGSDAAVEAMAAGADDYVRKPFETDELLARIRAHHTLNQIHETAIGTAESTADNLRQGWQPTGAPSDSRPTTCGSRVREFAASWRAGIPVTPGSVVDCVVGRNLGGRCP